MSETFSQILRERRQAASISIADAAAAVGVHRTTWMRWEDPAGGHPAPLTQGAVIAALDALIRQRAAVPAPVAKRGRPVPKD